MLQPSACPGQLKQYVLLHQTTCLWCNEASGKASCQQQRLISAESEYLVPVKTAFLKLSQQSSAPLHCGEHHATFWIQPKGSCGHKNSLQLQVFFWDWWLCSRKKSFSQQVSFVPAIQMLLRLFLHVHTVVPGAYPKDEHTHTHTRMILNGVH